MRSVLRLFATDGLTLPSINIKFESTNVILHAFLGKDVEELFGDRSHHDSVLEWANAPLYVFIDFLGVLDFWFVLDDVVYWLGAILSCILGSLPFRVLRTTNPSCHLCLGFLLVLHKPFGPWGARLSWGPSLERIYWRASLLWRWSLRLLRVAEDAANVLGASN